MTKNHIFLAALAAFIAYPALQFPDVIRPAQAAQEGGVGGHNYYAVSDSNTRQLLHNVEKYHMKQGIQKMRAGQFQYAFSEFDFILRYFPNHPQALLMMAELADAWKQPQRAEPYFDKALRMFPDDARTYVVHGFLLQKADKLDAAITQYEKGLALNDQQADGHYNLGLAYLDKKQYEKANMHAQKAYQMGYPLPALRDKLRKAGAWKEVTPAPSSEAMNETNTTR